MMNVISSCARGCDLHTVKAVLLIWLGFYSFVTLLAGASILWLLFLLVASVGSLYGLDRITLRRGDDDLVKEVIGDISTTVQDSNSDRKKDDYSMKIIGHRFCGLDAPENSLNALEACHKAGCTAVEFDISLTKDKVVVLFHDDTVDRLTNDTGYISAKNYNTVSNYDISVNHPFRDRFTGTKVATFEEAVHKCLEYNMRMFIDIKDSDKEVIDAICGLYEKYPMMYRRAIVSSFNPYIIYQIRQRKPAIVGSLAWRPYYFSYTSYSPDAPHTMLPKTGNLVRHIYYRIADFLTTWFFFHLTYRIVGASVVLIHKDTITRESVNWWRNRNIHCMAWTVNLASEKIHFEKNFKIPYLTDTMHAAAL